MSSMKIRRVGAYGLYATTESVAFAVEMFYGEPLSDPEYGHFMGIFSVIFSGFILWAELRFLRRGLTLIAAARKTQRAA
jgi:hypothetical protein